MSASVRQLKHKNSKKPTPDQENAVETYLTPGGRVCVDAGAGTGKTTTLIETLGEAVLLQLAERPSDNPMARILAVSFTVAASRQLKAKLKELLRDHEEATKKMLPQELWRYIESESHIQTIDSYLQTLFREIALQVGMSPAFEIPTGIEEDEIAREVIARVLQDPMNAGKWNRLVHAFPNRDYLPRGPENLEAMIRSAHQKAREFCSEIGEVRIKLESHVKERIHCGKSPPFSLQHLQDIVAAISGGNLSLQCPTHVVQDLLSHADDTYRTTLQLAKDFGDILAAYDAMYDALTRERGRLTYVDVAYWVWKYTELGKDPEWQESLRNRFDHVLVDEFQDTSWVQFSVIRHLIRPAKTKAKNRVMIIGDVKQSIYQWRSAEPHIFAKIIRNLKEPPYKSPDIDGLAYCALVTNFRSHPELIALYNEVFSSLFLDNTRGAIAGQIPYVSLEAKVPQGNHQAHIHVCVNPETDPGHWVMHESRRIAEIVYTILNDPRSGVTVRDDANKYHAPRAGQIALLFRRKRSIPQYVQELRRRGVSCVVQADISLFEEPEVSLVIDFLDWLANPDSKESITRILRSPLVALSDETLRYLASERFLLVRALKDWRRIPGLPAEDHSKIDALLRLRNDLRWDREGPKAALIERIIAQSLFDSVLLASEDGIQAQANLWLLIEMTNAWEEEELLPYREFVQLLKQLRDRAHDGREGDYPRAILADQLSRDSVRIMTVHAAKGLEFPVVIVPEANVSSIESTRSERMIRKRQIGMLLKPHAGDTAMPTGASIVRVRDQRHYPWVAHDTEESLLWLSPFRDGSGRFGVASPLAEAVSDDVAEFWRILYVVATRARDHLIFSIGQTDRNLWNAWMPFLRDTLQLGTTPGAITRAFSWVGADGRKGTAQATISVEGFPTPPPPTPAPIPASSPSGSAPAYAAGCSPFIPFKVNPSTFPILMECPRRYQYEVLWKTSGLRMPGAVIGASPPKDMSADAWGNRVHKALSLRDFGVAVRVDTGLQDHLRRNLRIVNHLQDALSNFESLPIYQQIMSAAGSKRPVFKEQTFVCLFPSPQVPLQMEGRSDLLFQSQTGEWVIVDYKAEIAPAKNSLRERIHRRQLDAYAWMIEASWGVRIARAVVAYVHPQASECSYTPDPARFEAEAVAVLGSVKLDPIKGLEAKPVKGAGGPCDSCPYSLGLGGPCEHS